MRVRWIGLILLAATAAACSQADSPRRSAASKAAPPSSSPAAELASLTGVGIGAIRADDLGRRIQSATLSIEVADMAEAERRVASDAEALGGYVQDSRAAGQAEHRTSSFVLRVPADRFGDAVEGVEALGKVLAASTQTEDVSQAYADLEMRLRVKRGVEARLRDILDRRAGKLSEIIEVENELARVVEEVERIEVALQGYDQQITWSTLKLELQEAKPIVEAGFRAKLADAFRRGFGTFASAITAITYLVTFLAPWLVLGGIVSWVMVRARRRLAAP